MSSQQHAGKRDSDDSGPSSSAFQTSPRARDSSKGPRDRRRDAGGGRASARLVARHRPQPLRRHHRGCSRGSRRVRGSRRRQSRGVDRPDAAEGRASAHGRGGRRSLRPGQRNLAAECVMLARQAGMEIWRRFGVPVYFYEAAASRPDRVHLENVRRGEFEGLRAAALEGSARQPDIGGPEIHPTAGASAVGARSSSSPTTSISRPARSRRRRAARAVARRCGLQAVDSMASRPWE